MALEDETTRAFSDPVEDSPTLNDGYETPDPRPNFPARQAADRAARIRSAWRATRLALSSDTSWLESSTIVEQSRSRAADAWAAHGLRSESPDDNCRLDLRVGPKRGLVHSVQRVDKGRSETAGSRCYGFSELRCDREVNMR
jgi:hypothetical protein